MASKQLSPSAQLLRHSKLFSLPPVLDRPPTERSGAQADFESNTATIHRPTHAAITTTNSARSKGDWGLKRNLPLRSTTKSSTPVIRVRHVDSIDHITDFESAADHVLSLRKYQEMNVPIHKQQDNRSTIRNQENQTARSVFDAFEPPPKSYTKALQGISPANKPKRNDKDPLRWKWNGPWLPDMDEVQFDKYIEKQIKSRRSEFRHFLWNWIIDKKWEDLNDTKMQEEGFSSKVEKPTLTEEEFQLEIVRLRKNDELWNIIWKFLDLPGLAPSKSVSGSLDHAQGPPATHPSAGLSYLRIGPQISNHPILGPVNVSPPVATRLLQSNKDHRGADTSGGVLVGVGGFVAEASTTDTEIFHNKAQSLGGRKYFHHPKHATIDSRGRVLLSVEKAQPDSVYIWENKVGDQETKDAEQTQTIEDQGKMYSQGRWDKLITSIHR